MKTGGPVKRHTELRPKRWGVKPAPKAPNWRREYLAEWLIEPKVSKRERSGRADEAHKRFVRILPCCQCGKWGATSAAHVATAAGQKGTALKVDDRQTIPLCDGPGSCHRYFDGAEDGPANPFRGWSKERKRRWAARMVKHVQWLKREARKAA